MPKGGMSAHCVQNPTLRQRVILHCTSYVGGLSNTREEEGVTPERVKPPTEGRGVSPADSLGQKIPKSVWSEGAKSTPLRQETSGAPAGFPVLGRRETPVLLASLDTMKEREREARRAKERWQVPSNASVKSSPLGSEQRCLTGALRAPRMGTTGNKFAIRRASRS